MQKCLPKNIVLAIALLTPLVCIAKDWSSSGLESINYRNISAPYPEDGVELGQGWDMVRGVKTNNICVTGKRSPIKSDASSSSYKLIFDAEQVRYERSMRASASYGGFGYSAYLNTALTDKNFNDRSKTYIFGQVSVDRGGEFLVGDGSGHKLETYKDVTKVNICGDGYVSAIKAGGSLSVIFELNSSLQELAKILQINAGASGYGASLDLSFNESSFQKITNEKTSIINIQQAGDQAIPLDVNQVKEKIKNFPNIPSEKAVPYQIIITPYSPMFYARFKSRSVITNYEVAYERLNQLYTVYNEAVLQPARFYTPYQPENKKIDTNGTKGSLLDDLTLLKRTTFCMKQIIDLCAIDNKQCPGVISDENFSDLIDKKCEMNNSYITNKEYYEDIQSILTMNKSSYLSEEIASEMNSINKNENLERTNELKEYDTATVVVYPLKDQQNNARNNRTDRFQAGIPVISPFAIYYKMLARSPLPRRTFFEGTDKQEDEKTSQDDALELAKSYCKTLYPNDKCTLDLKKVSWGDNITEQEKVESEFQINRAKKLLNEWVLNVVLAPFSRSFCNISSDHPFCVNAEVLGFYLPKDENTTISVLSGFSYKKGAPPVTRPSKKETIPHDWRPPRKMPI
jgi:hypothetical protein